MSRSVSLLALMFLTSLPVFWAQPAKGDAPEKVYQMYLDALHRDDVAVAYACSAQKPGQSEKTLRKFFFLPAVGRSPPVHGPGKVFRP